MIEIVTLPANPSRGAVTLEYRWLGGKGGGAPIVVFLHEGAGTIAAFDSATDATGVPAPFAGSSETLDDWPATLVRALGFRGLAYSRPGCGRPPARTRVWQGSLDILRHQARDILPALLDALDIGPAERRRTWLVGAREGATIALLYAAAHPDELAGAAIIAPQLFPEAAHSAQLLRVRAAFETTDLRERLARYHDDDDEDAAADSASLVDWNIEDELHRLRCPLLAIRGFPGDDYSAAAHIDFLKRHATGATPFETPARQHADSASLNRTIVRFIHRCTPLSQN